MRPHLQKPGNLSNRILSPRMLIAARLDAFLLSVAQCACPHLSGFIQTREEMLDWLPGVAITLWCLCRDRYRASGTAGLIPKPALGWVWSMKPNGMSRCVSSPADCHSQPGAVSHGTLPTTLFCGWAFVRRAQQ